MFSSRASDIKALDSTGCCPTGFPSIGASVADRADLYVLTVVYCIPCPNSSVRKLITGPIVVGAGSVLV